MVLKHLEHMDCERVLADKAYVDETYMEFEPKVMLER